MPTSRPPRVLAPLFMFLAGCTGGQETATSSASSTSGAGGATAERVWGVTVDDVTNLADITGALQKLSQRPTARVVFDLGQSPADYADSVKQIHGVAGVMGEIVDSSDVAMLDQAAYAQRAQDYLSQLDDVDIWEIGNEINGDPWLGPTNEVAPKMTAAYAAAKGLGKTTELTLYYNEGCYDHPDHEMFTWAQANVPDDMKQGLDYVLVSFYEDDCNGITPDWPSVFAELGEMFPHARIGFGECGTQDAAKKAAYVDRYYRMKIDHPRYVGGYFWWYFAEDMVPASQPLWKTLDDAIAGR